MTHWWAKGLIFENCSCQLVCPGHIHFDQLCTHERCRGYWAFQFDDGEVDSTRLIGRRAVIAFDSPQRMVDAARMLGKASREMRRLADELPSFSLDEEPARPIVHREGGPARGQSSSPQKPEDESEPKDVPVAFGPVEAKAEAERKPDEDEQP